MLNRNLVLLLFLSALFSQSTMNGYGYGMFSQNDEAAILGSGSVGLLPSFKNDVSLSNPSTWHKLSFTYLNTSFESQSNKFGSSSSKNSGLASAKLIIPSKQKISFGLTFKPLFSREITIVDSTFNEFIFAGSDTLDYSRSNKTGGGSSMAQFAVGYKLTDTDDIGLGIDVIFGSSRSSQNLIIDSNDHLLQSRDYFSGSLIEFYYTTRRFSFNDNPLVLSLNYNFSLNDIDVENESYQAFLDLNSNNYHDSQDYPNVAAALMPTNTIFKNEISISDFKAGIDYEFAERYHAQLEVQSWNNNGKNALSSSLYPGYIEGKSKINIGFLKFAKPYSTDKFHFRAGLSFSDYEIKNLDNVKEVGLGLGVGIEFGLMRNQIDIGYNLVNRDNIYNVGSETVQSFNVGVSIGDLWFVKRRKI
ncbi:MAG: hypothetical protein P8L43_01525 [Candidatus Marinimicrobia bacterium]|jgi:hypothetical protein|nr:hypothetical protein [Candidatus Neomarinimicrobiota bacterium]